MESGLIWYMVNDIIEHLFEILPLLYAIWALATPPSITTEQLILTLALWILSQRQHLTLNNISKTCCCQYEAQSGFSFKDNSPASSLLSLPRLLWHPLLHQVPKERDNCCQIWAGHRWDWSSSCHPSSHSKQVWSEICWKRTMHSQWLDQINRLFGRRKNWKELQLFSFCVAKSIIFISILERRYECDWKLFYLQVKIHHSESGLLYDLYFGQKLYIPGICPWWRFLYQQCQSVGSPCQLLDLWRTFPKEPLSRADTYEAHKVESWPKTLRGGSCLQLHQMCQGEQLEKGDN